MKQNISLSDSEWIIMQEIWKGGKATFREICDGVAGRGWSKPAVAAFLKRMENKGAIRCEEAKPVKIYHPLLKKETMVRRETKQILGRVYGGDVALLAQSLVRSKALDDDEVEELIALLKKGRGER